MTFIENAAEACAGADVSAMLLLSADGQDIELWPLRPEGTWTPREEFEARQLRIVGAVGLHGMTPHFVFNCPLPLSTFAALGMAFANYVRSLRAERLELPEADATKLVTIDLYPHNTLEGLIAREWASMILECEDHTINVEPIREVIARSRDMMRDAGWLPTYQHKFLLLLRNDLTALTFGHPVTRQFVQILTSQLEFN